MSETMRIEFIHEDEHELAMEIEACIGDFLAGREEELYESGLAVLVPETGDNPIYHPVLDEIWASSKRIAKVLLTKEV